MKNCRDVLILGSGGRLGPLLRRSWDLLADPDFRPIYQSTNPQSAPDVLWKPGDAYEVFEPADAIVALWGVTSGSAEELSRNRLLAIEAAKIAEHCGAKAVFHFSSAAVYGPVCALAKEDTPTQPISPYAIAKADMELSVAGFSDSCRHICLRLGNVVGADSLRPALLSQRPAVLDRFPSGKGPLRSYISPIALSHTLTLLCHTPVGDLPSTINLAAATPVRMEALLQAAEQKVDWRDAPETAVEVATLGTDRLQALIGTQALDATPHTMIEDWKKVGVA